jgi:uncharacterized membrane protein
VFGVIGYLLLGVIRVGWRRHPRQPLLVWGIALAGVAFSIYLTFLEPFVIGATCLWCINSAVIMTLILVAATPAAVRDRRHGRTRFANAHGLTTSSRSSAVRNRPRRGA